jgi:probable rRNA maturation factor
MKKTKRSLQVDVYSQSPITADSLKRTLKISKRELVWWCREIWREFGANRLFDEKEFRHVKRVQLIFVGVDQIKKLNLQYRKKNKPTDILSFEPTEKDSLGELVLCLPVLAAQAKEHKMKMWEELGYMLTHGMLHLLGYEHENNDSAAKKMYKAQEQTFEDLCRRFEAAKSKS